MRYTQDRLERKVSSIIVFLRNLVLPVASIKCEDRVWWCLRFVSRNEIIRLERERGAGAEDAVN